ncbi:hypothetical protein QT381_02755 [Galbitalea sp. SE-J8]|uniref:hypothetical protein n=1 Tax=Galbitalea sp. SE-J8 TaxID=3054952 RepID=UPI00259C8363|nr:hypothetical protein [Galbitalea sp. SE-J8]MDM4761924.1 hypothetical protein [Galbitalea sp. SE-J8]
MTGRPFKEARAGLIAMGCEVERRDKYGVLFRRPNGTCVTVHFDISERDAAILVRDSRKLCGLPPAMRRTQDIAEAERPVLDLTRLTASTHAQIRLRQMRVQSDIPGEEIIGTLRRPTRVGYSTRHESWLWVGRRIALAMAVDESGASVIKTVLWASEELWAAHPRPEKRTA